MTRCHCHGVTVSSSTMGDCDKWDNVCTGPATLSNVSWTPVAQRVPSTSNGVPIAQGHMSLYALWEKAFLRSQWRLPGTEGSSTSWRGVRSLPFSPALSGLMARENIYCESQSHVCPCQTGLFQCMIKLELSRVNFENPKLYQTWAPLLQLFIRKKKSMILTGWLWRWKEIMHVGRLPCTRATL